MYIYIYIYNIYIYIYIYIYILNTPLMILENIIIMIFLENFKAKTSFSHCFNY